MIADLPPAVPASLADVAATVGPCAGKHAGDAYVAEVAGLDVVLDVDLADAT